MTLTQLQEANNNIFTPTLPVTPSQLPATQLEMTIDTSAAFLLQILEIAVPEETFQQICAMSGSLLKREKLAMFVERMERKSSIHKKKKQFILLHSKCTLLHRGERKQGMV